MLEMIGLQDQVSLQSNIILLNLWYLQILAMNADNTLLNNTQSEALADMANSFVLENCVCCFNHTLQLSAKTLLCPFNAGLGKTPEDADTNNVDDLLNLESDDGDGEDDDKDGDGDKDKDSL